MFNSKRFLAVTLSLLILLLPISYADIFCEIQADEIESNGNSNLNFKANSSYTNYDLWQVLPEDDCGTLREWKEGTIPNSFNFFNNAPKQDYKLCASIKGNNDETLCTTIADYKDDEEKDEKSVTNYLPYILGAGAGLLGLAALMKNRRPSPGRNNGIPNPNDCTIISCDGTIIDGPQRTDPNTPRDYAQRSPSQTSQTTQDQNTGKYKTTDNIQEAIDNPKTTSIRDIRQPDNLTNYTFNEKQKQTSYPQLDPLLCSTTKKDPNAWFFQCTLTCNTCKNNPCQENSSKCGDACCEMAYKEVKSNNTKLKELCDKGCCTKIEEETNNKIETLNKQYDINNINKVTCSQQYTEFYNKCKSINEECTKKENSCQTEAIKTTKDFRNSLPNESVTLATEKNELLSCFDHDEGINKHVLLKARNELYNQLPNTHKAFLINHPHPQEPNGPKVNINPKDIEVHVPLKDTHLIGPRELTKEDLARRIGSDYQLRHEALDFKDNEEAITSEEVMKALAEKKSDYYKDAISNNNAIQRFLGNPNNNLPEGTKDFFQELHNKRASSLLRRGQEKISYAQPYPVNPNADHAPTGSKRWDDIKSHFQGTVDDYGWLEGKPQHSALTNSHELVHMLSREMSEHLMTYNEGGAPTYSGQLGLYLGDDQAISFEHPRLGLPEVTEFVSPEYKTNTYDLYLEGIPSQQPFALYPLDEWVAYTHNVEVGTELAQSRGLTEQEWYELQGDLDTLDSFDHYAKASLQAVEKYDPDYPELEKLRRFVAEHSEKTARVRADAEKALYD